MKSFENPVLRPGAGSASPLGGTSGQAEGFDASELRASMSFYNNQGYGRPQQPPMRSSHEQQMMRSRCADAHTSLRPPSRPFASGCGASHWG